MLLTLNLSLPVTPITREPISLPVTPSDLDLGTGKPLPSLPLASETLPSQSMISGFLAPYELRSEACPEGALADGRVKAGNLTHAGDTGKPSVPRPLASTSKLS